MQESFLAFAVYDANNKLSVVCVPERGVYFHGEEKKSGKFTLQMYTLSL